MCRLLGVGKQAYYKHVDKLMLKLAHELIVSDITYVPFWTSREREEYDFCHLSLVTDYYTEEIVGYSVGDTLETRYPLEAQEMRLRHYGGKDQSGLIHYSDRGVQYASYAYTARLRDRKISISLTESGNPKDNAVTEHVNNTIENELRAWSSIA